MEEEEDRSSLLVSLNEHEKAKLRFLTEQNPNSPVQFEKSRLSSRTIIEQEGEG